MYIYHRKTGLVEEAPEEPTFFGKIKNEGERGWHGGLAGLYTMAAEGGADTFDQIAAERKRVLSIPLSKELEKFGKSEGPGETLKNVVESPSVIPQLVAQSFTQTVPTVAPLAAIGTTAGPIGTATGVGIGSLITDYSAELLGYLDEQGVDTTDPNDLRKAYSNQKLMGKARERAAKHGIPVALLDALSGSLAGRFIKAGGFKPLGIAKETGTQMGLGATGETTGEFVSGQPFSAPDIVAEALGELGSAPIEVGAGLLGRRKKETDITTPPGKAMFSLVGAQPNEAGYYSRLARAVDNAPLKEGDATQWFNQLRKSPEGFSSNELTITGLDDFLTSGTKTKGEVQNYLKTNLTDIEIVPLRDPETNITLQNQNQPKAAYVGNEKYNTPGTINRSETFVTAPKFLADEPNTLDYGKSWSDGHGVYNKVVNPIIRERSSILNSSEGSSKIIEELQPPSSEEFKKMPKAYQENWKDIGIRHTVMDAARQGHDFIAITPGQIQSDRYSLEQVADRLKLIPGVNQSHMLVSFKDGAGIQ